MKFLSHCHINGNGTKYRAEYARILARAAKSRGYTHVAVGCHGNYIADRNTMDIFRKFDIVPVRFAELNLSVQTFLGTWEEHVSIINIPEKPVAGYLHVDHKAKNRSTIDNVFSPIDLVKRYADQVGAKLVLNHPKDFGTVTAFAPYVDGIEVENGAHPIKWEGYSREDMIQKIGDTFSCHTMFFGADYHVWKCKGNLDYGTQLPDNWFGEIYK